MRLPSVQPPELDQIMDFYWGGPERRITGITLRIIAVNAIALLMLLAGTLYLGQYQRSLIESKLQKFETELNLAATTLSEAAAVKTENSSYELDRDKTLHLIERLESNLPRNIKVFDREGNLIISSIKTPPHPADDGFYSVYVLKQILKFILMLVPSNERLPHYPGNDHNQAEFYPDAPEALRGLVSLSAWKNQNDEQIVLSAAAPLYKDKKVFGALLLTHIAYDIEKEVSDFWLNILLAFTVTLILTVFLSIYLSGVIARPLKRLASAAEGIRKGKATYSDIPDMSQRRDEIGELSISLYQMTKALWDRMSSIESFAADVAHELKNPLTSLRSAVETLPIVKKQKDRDRLMEIIKHDLERLDRLITDISAASRLDAELSRETLERVDIRLLLKEIVNSHKDPISRKDSKPETGEWYNYAQTAKAGISLNSDTSGPVFVWGTQSRLAQVFENLLSNALSFAPENSKITISVHVEGNRVIVKVDDQGPGIPENRLQNIFERFYSERPEHESYGQHSGLGLSICKQIVEAISGKIFAENRLDSSGKITGARFTVVLNKA